MVGASVAVGAAGFAIHCSTPDNPGLQLVGIAVALHRACDQVGGMSIDAADR
jgi:hypothetical protein